MPYPTRTGSKQTPKERGIAENLESLAGFQNNGAVERKAVTRQDASSMGVQVLRAARITSAPTADQYNALVDDMHALVAVLTAMGAKFQEP